MTRGGGIMKDFMNGSLCLYLQYVCLKWLKLCGGVASGSNAGIIYTVVSCICAPHFATIALVESVGGAYMRDLTFYLMNTPPLPVPLLDVDIGTLYYRPLEAADLPSLLILSSETRWSRSTDRGWPQRRQRVCPFNVLLLTDTTREHACDRWRIP